MSDQKAPAPRPVSLVAVAAIFVLLALFGVAARHYYLPTVPTEPQYEAPDHLTKDLAWKATHDTRRDAMLELREHQALQAASYRWIDRGAGVVQLPIDRAMDLVIQENGGQH